MMGTCIQMIIIRFIYYIYNYRLLYYLPMERMTRDEWMTPEEYIAMVEEENKVIKEEKEMLIRQNTLLQESNKKLKSDLEECECSMHFENDEVWFWKREYKRLKKWIKDHCKWYWNLFPEDEMKRQWKKADKKRK